MNEKGFSLLEVLVSVLLFMLTMAGMFTAFVGHLKYNADSETRQGAIAVAQQVLDDIRFQNPQTLPNSGSSSPQTITIDERDFDVVTSYCTNPSLCTSLNTRQIKVQVSYLGRTFYEVSTVYTKLK